MLIITTYVCVCVCVCTHIQTIYIYIYIYIYIHTHTHVYVETIDCGEFDSMIEIYGKLDESNT